MDVTWELKMLKEISFYFSILIPLFQSLTFKNFLIPRRLIPGSAYFHAKTATLGDTKNEDETDKPQVTDETVGGIDLNLDHTEAATIFAEENSEDIWNQPNEDDDESDTPAFLRRRKKNKKPHNKDK